MRADLLLLLYGLLSGALQITHCIGICNRKRSIAKFIVRNTMAALVVEDRSRLLGSKVVN